MPIDEKAMMSGSVFGMDAGFAFDFSYRGAQARMRIYDNYDKETRDLCKEG